jgi:methyltransferase-like protein
VEFRTWQAACKKKVSTHPKVSRLTAYQITRGETVTNQRHENVTLDAIGKELIRILDGKRDHKALWEHLKNHVEAGALVIRQEGVLLTNKDRIQQFLDQALKQTLKSLADSALLVG